MNISQKTDFDSAATGFDFEHATTLDSPPAKPREEALRGNLTRFRWHMPALARAEERALLRAAQAGDAAAKNELTKRYHRLVLSIAGQYYGPDFEDRVAAGLLGLATAIAKFDLRKNFAFASLAKTEIQYRILDEVRAWRRGGRAGATRADRYLDLHPNAAAVDVAAAVGCLPSVAADAVERREAWSAPEDVDAIVDWLAPTIARACHRIPDLIDRAADEADCRALRRLRAIGRRAYALELVERDRKRKRIEARSEPTQYLYPDVRLARLEAAQRLRKQSGAARRQRKQPRKETIRVWHQEHEPLMAAE